MKIRFYFFILALMSTHLGQAQLRDTTLWQPAKSLNKTRVNTVAVGGVGASAVALTGLYFAWYADYPQSDFHFYNDNANWGYMDKLGHATTTYSVGQIGYDLLKWSGVQENKAVWYGGLSGFTFMAAIEVMDGFSEEWGFSWGDFGFNTLGAGLFIAQQKLWQEQRFMLKFSAHGSKYAQYNPDLLGSVWYETWLKDYNGQTYWLSINPRSFSKNESGWWPRWLNVAAGYGIDGYVSADGSNTQFPQFTAQSQYYFSFDIDLRKMQVKNDFLRTVLHTVSFIKIPAPTLGINQKTGGTTFYWLYF